MRSLLLALFVVCAAPAAAQDFVGARAMGLGESYRAIATGNDALYFNPAGLPLLKRYSIEGHYLIDLRDERHVGDISLVDSKTNPLAVGLAYTFLGAELTRRTTIGHTATLGLAYPLFDEIFSIGVGLKYKNVSDAIAGNYLNAVTADVGVLSKVSAVGLSIGAVGYNLIPIRTTQSSHVPVSAALAVALDLGPLSALIFGGAPALGPIQTAAGVPTQGIGGLRGPLDGFTLSVDYLMNFETINGTQSRIATGLEWLILDVVPIRAGYQYDERTGDHKVAVGAGVIVPYFGIDIAYQQGLIAERLDERLFCLSLKGFLPM